MRRLLFFLVCLLILKTVNAQSTLSLVPYPNQIEIKDGNFSLSGKISIESDVCLKAKATYLQDMLSTLCGDQIELVKKSRKRIELKLSKSLKKQLGKEGYKLDIKKDGITIEAATPAGVFYGIKSLGQILVQNKGEMQCLLPCLSIEDVPAFGWRAFMLDESRYFKGTRVVKDLLDKMAELKMNVFHWHLVDDQGWRIEIKKYPKLTEIGSKRKDTQIGGWNSPLRSGKAHEGFYTQKEIQEIIDYATQRHITIVPEIEMPGHASAAIAAYPWLGSSGEQIEVPVVFGKMKDVYNIANPCVYEFVEDVLNEVFNLFPSQVVHIGGDEVLFDQWKENQQVLKLMKDEKLSSFADAQIYFTNKVSNFIDKKGHRMMGWNDILGGDVNEWQKLSDVETSQILAKTTIIHFWKGNIKLIEEAISQGYDIVNSHHIYTYLDYDYNSISLEKAYNFQPVPDALDQKYRNKVLGLGCQMWSEWIPQEKDLYFQVLPRLAAYAEVGWTNKSQKNFARFETGVKKLFGYWNQDITEIK